MPSITLTIEAGCLPCCGIECPTDVELGDTATVVISGHAACALCYNFISGSSVSPAGTIDGTYTLTWNGTQWQLLNHNVPGFTLDTFNNDTCAGSPAASPSLNLDFELFCQGSGVFSLLIRHFSAFWTAQLFLGTATYDPDFPAVLAITNASVCGTPPSVLTFGNLGAASITWP